MRTLTLALCVLFLTSAFRPIPARAGDDDARLARRVEMLLDLVAELKAEITELKARVAKLEAELDTASDDADPLPPFTEAEPYPVPPETTPEKAIEIAGHYALDRNASIQAVVERMAKGLDEEELIATRLEVKAQFANVGMELTFTKEGIFEASMQAPFPEEGEEPENHTARGTWKRVEKDTKDGSVHLTLVTTHEDGEVAKHGETIEGILRQDGSLHLQQPDDDFVLIFTRK